MSKNIKHKPLEFHEYQPGNFRARINEHFSYHIKKDGKEFVPSFEYRGEFVCELIPREDGLDAAAKICRKHFNLAFSGMVAPCAVTIP